MNKRLVTDITFFLGLAALLLRRMLYITATDGRGLLQRMHPLSLVLLALTAAVFLLIFLTARTRKDSKEWEAGSGALGHVFLAAGILYTVLTGMPRTTGYLNLIWQWLGMVAPVCLLAAGIARMGRKKPFFLLHVVPCLFFVVHIVCHYQTWSGNPQMQDYVFALLGAMALMFLCFYTAALEAGCGSRRMVLGMGLAAIYLCLAELGNSVYPVLYFAGAIWARTELFEPRKTPSPEED